MSCSKFALLNKFSNLFLCPPSPNSISIAEGRGFMCPFTLIFVRVKKKYCKENLSYEFNVNYNNYLSNIDCKTFLFLQEKEKEYTSGSETFLFKNCKFPSFLPC